MARLLSSDPADIAQAVEHLRSSGLVAFPTETVYGLGASARDARAVARVFAAKGRPADHPLIVHLPSAEHLWQWADRDAVSGRGLGPDVVERVAAEFWPGPLTLVLPALPAVPRDVTGGQDTVALRVPAGDVPRRLLAAFGEPLVAPSANRFGRVSPTRAAHVLSEFSDEDVLVIDGGQTAHGLESTIVDLSSGAPRLLRPGALPLTRLAEYLTVDPRGGTTGAPRAPGTLARHYAPSTPMRLTRGEDLERRSGERTGVIATRPPYDESRFTAVPGGELLEGARWLVLPPDAAGFGRELFAAVRHLDELGLEEVLVEEPPSGDEWLAVRDRLKRAAAPAGKPLVAVVMGSASDWETMRAADEVLEQLGVPHVCKVVSAHRTPERLSEFARGAAGAGYQVIVAGAGGAAHLPGMIAAHTHLPVFGVPVRSSALSGIDSLLSVVQMPSGVPVGTLAIGQAGAANAALLAVAVLALHDDQLRERLVAYRQAQTERAAASELPTASFEP